MIEVVYTPQDNSRGNDIIRLPRNIKQIGDIKDSRKIYIEDYAINYLEELGKEERTCTGVLVGTAQKSGSDRYSFIKGAICGPDVFISESQIAYLESDWSYIYEMAGKYFPGLDIIGWFFITENLNMAMSQTIKRTFASQFAGAEKSLFIYERQENQKYFMVYDNNKLDKQKGFTIYYERNEEMQEYMVDMREESKRSNQPETIPEERESYRALANTEEPVSKSSSRQAIVNYCANVAMVVLILFIGMYVLDSRNSNATAGNISTLSTQATITPVVKVDGNVYPTDYSNSVDVQPTESVNDNTESMGDFISTETETTSSQLMETVNATVGTNSETTQEGTYVTVNNQVETVKSYEVHTVAKGENLITISKKYYGSNAMVAKIMELNNIEDMDKIYEGQKIKLP